ERVGGTQTISVDVRIVAATNKDLKAEIAKGNFREDLFYRLNVIPFHVPPLRERKEDIPLLAEHFLKEFAVTHGKKLRTLTKEGTELLKAYSWPGNVRELKNLIERLMILTLENDDGAPITANHLLSHLHSDAMSAQIAPRTDSSERTGTSIATSARNLRDARSE